MDISRVSRRAFVGAAAGSSLVRSASANDRISIGLIGAGGRGIFHLANLAKLTDYNFAITAICDIYRPNRERGVAAVEKTWGAKPRSTTDYREMLSWKDVDAVIIAAPDFTHSVMLKHAVEAGKDAYCEKPMGVNFAEAKAAFLAVKKSGRVVQIGTQRRSDPGFMEAARLVRSGVLGTVTRVDMSMNFQEPRWRRKDVSSVKADDVAWDQFLMGRAARAFDARLLREWQLFRFATNGIPGLWMSHFIDLVPWYLEDPYPASVVAQGGVYLWKDGRETSDVFHALLEYPKGFLVSFSMSLTNSAGTRNLWFGSRGTLDLDAYLVSGAGSSLPDRIAKEINFRPQRPAPGTPDPHMRNFLECLRSRQQPNAPIEAGFSHAVAGCMSAVAMETGRRVRFDRDKLELV
jgi:predicted dehydrogenase